MTKGDRSAKTARCRAPASWSAVVLYRFPAASRVVGKRRGTAAVQDAGAPNSCRPVHRRQRGNLGHD